MSIKPTKSEKQFLHLAYERFVNLVKEIKGKHFWDHDAKYRLAQEKELFLIYTELSSYNLLKELFNQFKNEPENKNYHTIGVELFQMLRNVFTHFPFFETYNDIWINHSIVNWLKPEKGRIAKFFKNNLGKNSIEQEYLDEHNTKKNCTIKFPTKDQYENKLFIKDILGEKEGILYCSRFMSDAAALVGAHIKYKGPAN